MTFRQFLASLRRLRIAAPAAACVSLMACANPAPISTNPTQTVVNEVTSAVPGLNDTIATGITNADYNLGQAMQLGILPATDPAKGCLDSASALLGIGGTPAPQFTPKISDLISAGSVGYIDFQQLQQLIASGGLANSAISPQCEQLIGQMVIQSAAITNKAIIGNLPTILPLLAAAKHPAASTKLRHP